MRMTEDMTTNRVAERIIRSRGEVPSAFRAQEEASEPPYVAALVTEGFPQMGFSLFCKDGSRHGFLYHNLENIDLCDGEHGSYLRFTHRGKAATLRGRHLHEAFQAIMEHTLQAFYEFDATSYLAVREGEALIDFVRVDDVNPYTVDPNVIDQSH